MVIMRFPNGLRKAVTLSFDDGVEQDADLKAMADRHGLKITFNVNGGLFAPEGKVYKPGTLSRRMSRSQCHALYDGSGHEVAAHGFTHPQLPSLPDEQIVREIFMDRLTLEEEFDTEVRGFAYPYGTFDDRVVNILRECGLSYARTVHSTHWFDLPKDWLRLDPTCHHEEAGVEQLIDRFFSENAACGSMMFYMWGHSYELERDNCYERTEKLMEMLGGHDDVWYATNGEIREYAEAYQQLRWSANGQKVYNPTCTDVWIDAEYKTYRIPAGQTVML